MIFSNILKNGASTINQLKDDLGLEMKDIRYHTLRLAQMRKLSMVVGDEEPIFSPYIEE